MEDKCVLFSMVLTYVIILILFFILFQHKIAKIGLKTYICLLCSAYQNANSVKFVHIVSEPRRRFSVSVILRHSNVVAVTRNNPLVSILCAKYS